MGEKMEKKPFNFKFWGFVGVIVLAALFTWSTNNQIIDNDESVKTQWSKVLNQYQRRADLVPQLVSVVSGYASHEKDTLSSVIEARSKATSIQLTPEVLNNPEALKNYEAAQTGLTQALSKLMVLQEKYPNLKADKHFSDLQTQIEGTENRIATARTDFIEAINVSNKFIRKFPRNIVARVLGYSARPNFEVENQKAIEKAPEINFGKK